MKKGILLTQLHIFCCLGIVVCFHNANAQLSISMELEYRIKVAVIKNEALGTIFFNNKYSVITDSLSLMEENSLSFIKRPLYFLQYPGFGYLPDELNWKISQMKLNFTDKDWKFYKVDFLNDSHNDTLVSWSNYKYYSIDDKRVHLSPVNSSFIRLAGKKNILIAVNKNMQIKFISGSVFCSAIAQDFKLKEKNPESYLPFVLLKLFYLQYKKIEFARKEDSLLVFLATGISHSGKTYQYEYYLNPKSPERFVKTKNVTPKTPYIPSDTIIKNKDPYANYKIDLGFANVEDKKRYMLDALMKNIYMYRLLHLDSLAERLNIDTTTWHLREGVSDLDSLLPNYDEYLGEFALLRYGFGWDTTGYPYSYFYTEGKSRIDQPIFDEPNKLANHLRIVVGTKRIYDGVEFYKFYKNRDEILFKRPSKYTEQTGGPGAPWCEVGNFFGHNEKSWYRFDYYYHPEYKTEYKLEKKQPLSCENISPPYPLSPPNITDLVTNPFMDYKFGDEFRSPYSFIDHSVDHYLVALDTKTREVYFVSGKDIYLSKATALYRFGGNGPQEPESLEKWELSEKLTYIRDRLYRYRVESVKEENIISKDDIKMILEVSGWDYDNKIKLKVTFFNATPEMLKVEEIR